MFTCPRVATRNVWDQFLLYCRAHCNTKTGKLEFMKGEFVGECKFKQGDIGVSVRLITLMIMRNIIWKRCYVKCGVWNQMEIWSSHLLDNLSNCLMDLKNSGDSTGFEPMTSAMPVQCSNQLSYEVTQLRAGQFVRLIFSRERNVVWKKCYMKCGVWNQMKIWSSHLLDNLGNCLMCRTVNVSRSGLNDAENMDHYWGFCPTTKCRWILGRIYYPITD